MDVNLKRLAAEAVAKHMIEGHCSTDTYQGIKRERRNLGMDTWEREEKMVLWALEKLQKLHNETAQLKIPEVVG